MERRWQSWWWWQGDNGQGDDNNNDNHDDGCNHDSDGHSCDDVLLKYFRN